MAVVVVVDRVEERFDDLPLVRWQELRKAKDALEAAGIPILGITDHKFINSIYFFDPNGIRLELTCDTGMTDYKAKKLASAHDDLAGWTRDKAARQKEPVKA